MKSNPSNVDMNERLECAETLASRYYTDPAILALEKERIFRRTWQLVGTLSQSCGEVNGECGGRLRMPARILPWM